LGNIKDGKCIIKDGSIDIGKRVEGELGIEQDEKQEEIKECNIQR